MLSCASVAEVFVYGCGTIPAGVVRSVVLLCHCQLPNTKYHDLLFTRGH
jgi:hypothetical protein